MQEQINIFISSYNAIEDDNELPNQIFHDSINTMEFNSIHVTKNCMIEHLFMVFPQTVVFHFHVQLYNVHLPHHCTYPQCDVQYQ